VIDLDVVTTPGCAMMVKHLEADGALIATASHNPIQWNGLKFLNGAGIALPAPAAAKVAQAYQDELTDYVRVENLFSTKKNAETHALHIKRVLEFVDTLGISSKRFKVVLDSVNGAGLPGGAYQWHPRWPIRARAGAARAKPRRPLG
jgi:phosphomannomutase